MPSATLEDPLNDGVPNGVEEPQIGPGDNHEPHRHGGALADLATVGPLDTAQLEVGRAQEVGGAPEETLARSPRAIRMTLAFLVRAQRLARAADRAAGLGYVGLGDVGHRLPKRVRGLGVAEVALEVVVADAIAVAEVGFRLAAASRVFGGHVLLLPVTASRGARDGAGTTCSTCAG